MTALATTVADHRGHLIPKLRQLLPALAARFEHVAVAATTGTPTETLDLLRAHGAAVAIDEPDARFIGRHRRQALALAAEHGQHVAYLDLDHALRWVEHEPAELEETLARAVRTGCLVIGRTQAGRDALPRRLRDTEAIVNHVYALTTGRAWDLMMAARAFSPAAARSVAQGCLVDTIANDVAWPLHCERAGFALDYVEARGLTYLTNDEYARGAADDRKDRDPRLWARRVEIAWQHVAEIVPYMPQPTARPSP
jgi:hypothetical protein